MTVKPYKPNSCKSMQPTTRRLTVHPMQNTDANSAKNRTGRAGPHEPQTRIPIRQCNQRRGGISLRTPKHRTAEVLFLILHAVQRHDVRNRLRGFLRVPACALAFMIGRHAQYHDDCRDKRATQDHSSDSSKSRMPSMTDRSAGSMCTSLSRIRSRLMRASIERSRIESELVWFIATPTP